MRELAVPRRQAVAGGRPMLNWATDSWDIEVLAVLGSGELLATPGFRA